MVSSGLLHRVAIVRTDVSEEIGATFIRVTKIGELGTTQAATSNRRTLRRLKLLIGPKQYYINWVSVLELSSAHLWPSSVKLYLCSP
jgi:hypothetical protein